MKEVKDICPGSSYKALLEGALLVDVREKDEYEKVRFEAPRVMHIPYSEFDERFSEIPRDKTVIVACSVGDRSQKVAFFLRNNGYTEVANLKGGLAKWLHKQYPVEGDKYAPVTAPESCCSTPAAEEKKESSSCCGGKNKKAEKNLLAANKQMICLTG